MTLQPGTGTRVDGNAGDDDGHGTLLSGIIAGVARQKIGLDYAPQPVKLMAVKFYDPVTLPAPANAAAAIRYAVRQGAKIICASWDVGIQTPELADAIAYAESSGVLIVTAAGNFGTDNDSLPTWPASTPRENVMAVMATDHRDERADFSNFGRSTVHLAAPGVDVLSTARSFTTSPRWLPFTGTSPAAAHVTGAAALLKAINPDWGPTMLRKHLMGSAQRIRGLECVAEGRLDLERAVLGPLCELSPRDGDVWKSGSDVQVRWTRRYETPGCQTVSLLLSEDGGRSYSVVLAPQQPNDGVCSVRVPPGKVSAARLRLMSDQGRFTTESGLFSIW